MMPAKNLVAMVLKNTLRSPRHFILSAFGIVIGIGAFVLFLALTQRAGSVIESVFPVEEVEVVAPRVSTLESMVGSGKKLDDDVVKMLLDRPDVKHAVPRMALAFPAAGRGDFEGTDLKFEVGGFADGVDPAFVVDPSATPPSDGDDPKSQTESQKRIAELFRDWDDPAVIKEDEAKGLRAACTPPPRDTRDDIIQSPGKPPDTSTKPPEDTGWGPLTIDAGVEIDADSADGSGSGSGSGSAVADAGSAGSGSADGSAGSGAGSGSGSIKVISKTGKPKRPEYFNPCKNPDRYYCDDKERICKHRVPVVLSTTVVELYNNQFAKVHKMPVADKNMVNFLIQNRGLSAMRFSLGLGNTTIAGTGKRMNAAPRRVEAVVVGVSPRAMRIGVTMPVQYMRRWNQEYLGEEAASSYSSIITTVKDRNRLGSFIEWLKTSPEKGGAGLSHEDNLGEKFASVVEVVRLLFLIISIAILVIAVINIGHNFFVQVTERRREIGIMRAVGASQADVLLVILGEAAVIGVIGGLLGIGVALGIGGLWNWYAETGVAAFPHKPTSWFDFKPWIWGSGLVFSTMFCIIGGYLPARRAAHMEPAQALAQN